MDIRWILRSEIVDIRVEILDKNGQSTVNTGPNSAEIFSIHGGAYLQINGEIMPKSGQNRPKSPENR